MLRPGNVTACSAVLTELRRQTSTADNKWGRWSIALLLTHTTVLQAVARGVPTEARIGSTDHHGAELREDGAQEVEDLPEPMGNCLCFVDKLSSTVGVGHLVGRMKSSIAQFSFPLI